MSDKEVTLRSGPSAGKDDMIMADRGFHIRELVATKGI